MADWSLDNALDSFVLWAASNMEGITKSEGNELFERIMFYLLLGLYDNGYEYEDLDDVFKEQKDRLIMYNSTARLSYEKSDSN